MLTAQLRRTKKMYSTKISGIGFVFVTFKKTENTICFLEYGSSCNKKENYSIHFLSQGFDKCQRKAILVEDFPVNYIYKIFSSSF